MTRLACDGPTLIRSVAAAVANLERHVSEVDALNVFPVPDGDTGSNMLATMRAALAEVERLASGERELPQVAAALGRGALRGARGNSGVILAQIVRGMGDGVGGRRRATGAELADGLRRGAESAYGCLASPVEGTIITVIRDAADAAASQATSDRRVETVLDVAIDAATRSLARTPALLPILAEAGVVDSGGQGLLRLLEGTRQLDGRAPVAASDLVGHDHGVPHVSAGHPPGRTGIGFGFETVFFVESPDGTLDLEAIRKELGTVAESVVVAGDRSAARVHVHGADPDLAIAVGRRAGRLSDIGIVDLDAVVEPASSPGTAITLVAVAEAHGLATLLVSLGVVVVPAADAVEAAVATIAGTDILVLAVQDGAAVDGSQVTGTTVLGMRDVAALVAAALAFDPEATLEANVARMTSEAGRVRTFDVAHGEDPVTTTVDGLRAREGDGFELVTLYGGPDVARAVVEDVRSAIEATWPGSAVDIVLVGQVRHALLVALD